MANASHYDDSIPEFNRPNRSWRKIGDVAKVFIPRSVKMTIVLNADTFLDAIEQYEKYLQCGGVDEEVAIDGQVRSAMPHRHCMGDERTDAAIIYTLLSFGQHEADIDTLTMAASYGAADTPHKILCAAEDLNAIARHFFAEADA